MAARRLRPLVARVDELEVLVGAVREAAEGRPSVTVVRGDAGIGKTRLVLELCAGPPLPGVVVLRGDCFRVDAGELPFAPLAVALRDAGPEALSTAAGEVSGGARRQLGRMFPHLFATDDPAQPVDSDRHAQRQLFDALLSLLGALSRATPLLLVLEDFHWVDRSTRDFVGFLARSVRTERLATVVTYRSDALPPSDPTAQMVAELVDREPTAAVELTPLSAEALAEHARNVVGEAARPRVVAVVYARSQGNPFFAEELLAAHVAGHGDDVPAAIASAALPRVARVSPEAQRALRVVAGIQRPVSWSLLQEVCGLTADVLSRAVREALDHHLLTDDEHMGGFAFRHDLVREAVYGQLHAGERAALHLAIAHALSDRHEGGNAELALHWSRAGRREAAVPACVQAGLDSERARAFGAAAGHFESALRLWDDLDAPPDGVRLDRIDVLAHLADAYQRAGNYRGAVVACRRALETLDAAADPNRAADFHERLGALHSAKSEVALESFQQALALLPVGDGARRARLIAGEASSLWGLDRWAEACARAEEAIQLAGEAEAAAEAFYARVVLALALGSAGRREEGEETLRAALERPDGARADDRLRAFLYLGEVCRMKGRFDAACEAMDDGARLAETLGLRGAFGTYMTVNAASDLFHLGRWTEAGERLEQLQDLHLEHWTEILVHQVTAQLALAQDRRPDAAAALERAKALGDAAAPEFLPPVYATLGELVLVEAGPAAARAIVAEGLAAVEAKAELIYTPMLYSTAARIEAEAASAAADAGDRLGAERGAAAARRLHAGLSAQIAAAGGDDPPPTATAHLLSCWAEVLRAEAIVTGRRRGDSAPVWENAAEAWSDAAEAWSAVAAPYPAAYAAWRGAEALLMQAGRRSAGPALLRAASAEAERIDAVRLTQEIAAMAARTGINLATAPGPPVRAPLPHGLTRRELDVLALLADGKSNQAIADALVISVRTAETHVARVLSKLNVTSRAQASSVANRPGLAEVLSRQP